MLIRKGYKFRLDPSTVQRADMVMFAGHNRAVWNKVLALTKDRLERKKPILWFHELNWNMVNFWKKSEEMSWLNDGS
ncbi:MAG: helix-turn-helix domain-containing protein [Mariprofundaceae bacterium]|nr:helix-turn-helix domain-containing protein [Mariprofundaceae bacterium]